MSVYFQLSLAVFLDLPLFAVSYPYPHPYNGYFYPLTHSVSFHSRRSSNRFESLESSREDADPLNAASKLVITATSQVMQGIEQLFLPFAQFVDTIGNMIGRFVHPGRKITSTTQPPETEDERDNQISINQPNRKRIPLFYNRK